MKIAGPHFEIDEMVEPTPDFIPGWFEPRLGNPDPAPREAVRIPEVGDHFPVTFLRGTERVSPDGRCFRVGPTSESGHDRFDLAVGHGCWLLRDGDGHLQVRDDDEFRATYARNEGCPWTSPADRLVGAGLRDNPHPPEGTAEEFAKASEAQHGTPPDGWQGTFPTHTARLAECYHLTGADPDGASDAMLAREALDEVRRFRKSYSNALRARTGDDTRDLIGVDAASLAFADAVEEALLKIDIGADPNLNLPAGTVERVLRDNPHVEHLLKIAQERWERIGDLEDQVREIEEATAALDRIGAPQGANCAERIDRLYLRLLDLHRPARYGRDDAWASEIAAAGWGQEAERLRLALEEIQDCFPVSGEPNPEVDDIESLVNRALDDLPKKPPENRIIDRVRREILQATADSLKGERTEAFQAALDQAEKRLRGDRMVERLQWAAGSKDAHQAIREELEGFFRAWEQEGRS